ncbi:MarR family winged helix-turn-helix transcriptional regulator [Fodinicola acaciae]|uniref:MarR family winged helix-turn-helix transcriptional regulator n=1 Tax=Fodinicola acaciae TaxID=2681555 RepID=UPI0013D5D82E|nr:MarR family winged helix-turn-helix transcriptional regulator [Fodinicola acaciae]
MPAHAKLAREIGLAVRELVLTDREMEAALARRLGVGLTDVRAMEELVAQPGTLGPVELGKRLGITSASATALVDRLEVAGHLARRRHPDDRRRITLELTESARADFRAALGPLLASIGRITAGLDPDRAAVIAAFLSDVTAAVRDFAAENDAD